MFTSDKAAWPPFLCRICIHLRYLQQMADLRTGQRNILEDKTAVLDFNRCSVGTDLIWCWDGCHQWWWRRSSINHLARSVYVMLWSYHSWGNERFSCWYQSRKSGVYLLVSLLQDLLIRCLRNYNFQNHAKFINQCCGPDRRYRIKLLFYERVYGLPGKRISVNSFEWSIYWFL